MIKEIFLNRCMKFCITCVIAIAIIFSGQASAEVIRFNMSYWYFGSTDAAVNYVERTNDSLQVISPTYFDIDTDGSLTITQKFDQDFIEEMHDRGIKVVPFLSNHWDRTKGRAALENKGLLVKQIVDAVENYNLDGVNVDIENLTEDDRENYVDFVQLLREKMPENKEVSVAVAANPHERGVGWRGSYDYKALAEYCDYLMIMAYDETYQGNPPGSVASISFVEKSIQYALERVPAKKIVLGIPFYGRYWKLGQENGGYGIHLTKVQELIERYNGNIVFDEYRASPKATITIKPGQEPNIFGKTLTSGTYEIWYENELSIKHKLRLVQKYDLKGTGSWSLGQETEDVWDYYATWLNGNWFVDTKDHWAQEAISDMEERGWMKGISSTHFAPDKPLTRAQAAVILVRALNLEEDKSNNSSFIDVSGRHWAKEEIEIISQHGIMKGISFERFAPEQPLTREQMAVMLDRIFGKEEVEETDNLFKDINLDRWSYQSILTMNAQGIFMGYEDGTFRPKENISRAQMAALMSRLSVYID